MLPASHHSLRFQSLRSGFEEPSLALPMKFALVNIWQSGVTQVVERRA